MADVVAEAKRALALSDEWWRVSGAWPTTSPPDGAYEDFSYEGVRDLVRALVARVEAAESDKAHATRCELDARRERDEARDRLRVAETMLGHCRDTDQERLRELSNLGAFSRAQAARAQTAEAQVDYTHRQNAALMERMQTAEAAYQEAQLTIAGLEKERDHARETFVRTQAELCRVRQVRDDISQAFDNVRGLYAELLFAVGNKYPDESRHQTALRYIQQAEQPSGDAALARWKEQTRG